MFIALTLEFYQGQQKITSVQIGEQKMYKGANFFVQLNAIRFTAAVENAKVKVLSFLRLFLV